MGELSVFESRTGQLKCSPKNAFAFLSDFNNLEKFVPAGAVKDLVLEKEACTFRVEMLGNVRLFISAKEEFSRIEYGGIIPQVKEFSASVEFKAGTVTGTGARIIVRAELNPFLRMMVSDAVNKGLESVITGMESFNGWPEDH